MSLDGAPMSTTPADVNKMRRDATKRAAADLRRPLATAYFIVEEGAVDGRGISGPFAGVEIGMAKLKHAPMYAALLTRSGVVMGRRVPVFGASLARLGRAQELATRLLAKLVSEGLV